MFGSVFAWDRDRPRYPNSGVVKNSRETDTDAVERREAWAFTWWCDVDVGIAEISLKDRRQILPDLIRGMLQAGDLRDATAAAEAVTFNEEVPSAGPPRHVHDEASGRPVTIREGARVEHVLNLRQGPGIHGRNGEDSWTTVLVL
jgi:hypothetical protein